MTNIPVIWIPLAPGEMPIFEKGAGVPFLAMQGNGHDAVLVRMQHRFYFQFIEVSSTIGPEALKSEILKVMRNLFDTWTGILPEAGKPSFYGVINGHLQTVGSISFVHIGIGYTTYPVGGVEYGVEIRNREFCEANQLPQELVING
jgi:hypothetical protein